MRPPGTSKARGLASCVAADDPTLLPPCLALPSYRQEAGASDLRGPCVPQAALEAAGKLLPRRGGARLGPSSLLLVTARGQEWEAELGACGRVSGRAGRWIQGQELERGSLGRAPSLQTRRVERTQSCAPALRGQRETLARKGCVDGGAGSPADGQGRLGGGAPGGPGVLLKASVPTLSPLHPTQHCSPV